MQWNVKGAWKADGNEGQMSVDALSKPQAEKIAASRGLLVESAWPADRNPEPSAAAEPRDIRPPRSYDYGQHSLLGACSTLFLALGSIAVFVAGLQFFAGFTDTVSNERASSYYFLSPIFLGNGVILIFTGAIGQAIREIAINTRR